MSQLIRRPVISEAAGIHYGVAAGKAIALVATHTQVGTLAAGYFLRGFALGFKKACTQTHD